MPDIFESSAEDDFVQLDKTQLLIQQLKETRHYKIMEGLNQIDSTPIGVNISSQSILLFIYINS